MNILVTGGGRGIGRATALAFARPGNIVAISARTGPQLDEVAMAVASKGGRPVILKADVSDEGSVDRAFAELQAVTPTLDVVVNNAGVGGGQPIDRTETAAWRRVLDTNVWGMFLVTRRAVPMLADGGRVINM